MLPTARARGRPASIPCFCPGCSTFIRRPQTGRHRCSCGLVFDLYVTLVAAKSSGAVESSEVVPEAASEAKPGCVSHPQNASVVACSRCGDYICEVCRIRIEGGEYCPKCFEHRVERAELHSLQRKFKLPALSLIVGSASILGFCMPYFSIFGSLFAIGLGTSALMQIRKKPGLPGKGMAIAGIILGAIGAVLAVLLFVVIFFGIMEDLR